MNKYEILSLIGEGAYGIVMKAKNRESGEIVAIKKFKESEDDESARKTILREVKILKMLKHENIVQLREAFRRKGKLYLVFEYVDKNLLEIIEENQNGIEPEKIKWYIYQLCKAINFCHMQNVIHRDIKPENLLISLTGSLRLCDFGFARLFSNKDPMTDYVATRWYRAPELLVGFPYDLSVDMWAIGCMMAELIDGQPLFPGESDIDQIYCIQKCLGMLIPQHQEAFQRKKEFSGLKLPKIQKLESVEKRYQGKIDRNAIEFIENLIQMDPSKRLTASQALQHSYFNDVVIDKRPQTSLSIERGRSAFSSNYYRPKISLPVNPSPNNTQQKKSQKNYLSIPPDKKRFVVKEYGKVYKKHLTHVGERHEVKGNNPAFRITSNDLHRRKVDGV
ncbi:hypothetical protein SteCoe_28742 [Stentor coeruleus]|uniref:cyclin-dependent kinase n=1 Tax=Stentor coeruleus TaxID=5963 RepID=A0A1R2B7L2_9CILI|nr:hypothetical protein SteCoe_28742 [Stentor coeruleus]